MADWIFARPLIFSRCVACRFPCFDGHSRYPTCCVVPTGWQTRRPAILIHDDPEYHLIEVRPEVLDDSFESVREEANIPRRLREIV
jgi:hypothetical protein